MLDDMYLPPDDGKPKKPKREPHPNFAKYTKPARLLEFEGEKKSINAWSKIVGISDVTIAKRLKLGWTVEAALTTPPDQDVNWKGVDKHDTTSKKFRDTVTNDLYNFYNKYGRVRFLKWLKQEFETNAGKAMKDYIFPNIPKEVFAAVDPSLSNKAKKAQIQIAVITTPQQQVRIEAKEADESG